MTAATALMAAVAVPAEARDGHATSQAAADTQELDLPVDGPSHLPETSSSDWDALEDDLRERGRLATGDLEGDLELAQAIQPFLEVSDAGLVGFDHQAALSAGVPEAHVAAVLVDVRAVTDVRGDTPRVLSCQGETSYSTHWWGQRLRLNSCHADDLVHLVDIGATIGTIAGLITTLVIVPVGVAITFSSLLVSLGASWVNLLNRNDCGVNLRLTAGVLNGSQQC